MGIFDKLFKKKDTDKEVCTSQITKEAVVEKTTEIKPNAEKVLNEEVISTRGSSKDKGIQKLKDSAVKIKKISIDTQPVDYENFLEKYEGLDFDELSRFTKYTIKFRENLSEIEEDEDDLIDISSDIEHIKESLYEMKAEVEAFREKDSILRKQILEYTDLINEINEKKLQGEEFEKVKAALEPKLNDITAKREKFLEEERRINSKLKAFNHNVVKLQQTCKGIAGKID